MSSSSFSSSASSRGWTFPSNLQWSAQRTATRHALRSLLSLHESPASRGVIHAVMEGLGNVLRAWTPMWYIRVFNEDTVHFVLDRPDHRESLEKWEASRWFEGWTVARELVPHWHVEALMEEMRAMKMQGWEVHTHMAAWDDVVTHAPSKGAAREALLHKGEWMRVVPPTVL
jgi:hypothetical protein